MVANDLVTTNFLSNSHIMVYKYLFIIDHHYMQSIKQLRDGTPSVGCMTYLYTSLYDRFEALRDRPLSVGCTCSYLVQFGGGLRVT